MKRNLLLILISLLCSYSYAADSAVVTGKVIDEYNEPLVFVSVAAYNSGDSSFVVGNVTNEQGMFSLNLTSGSYFLKLSYLSYHTLITETITVTNVPVSLDNIVLKANVEDLQGTEIVIEKSTVEFKIDKKVFNVGEDVASQGKDALQVLNRVPSVNTTQDGTIKVNGSENVRVLIDGKPVVGGLVNVLKTIPADMIEKVEVITNPSARYDAEGEAGIINIVLKKQRSNGLLGNITVSGGQPVNSSISGRLNYRTDKFSVNSSYRTYNYQTTSTSKSEQRYFTSDTALIMYQNSLERDESSGSSFNFGGSYNLNKFNSLSASVTSMQNNRSSAVSYNYYDLDSSKKLLQYINRATNTTSEFNNTYLNLSHTKAYDVKDKKWETVLRYSTNKTGKNRNIFEMIPLGSAESQTIQSNENRDKSSFFFKTDYHHPLSKTTFYEVGAQSSMEHEKYSYINQELLENDGWRTLDDYTNTLIFDNDVHAAYALYGNESGKIKYQVGLRSEYTFLRTELTKTNEVNPREYINLFPSAHFSHNLDSFNSLQLSYSRRIFRPDIFFLTPTNDITSRRSVFNGNPNFLPLFNNSFEFSYIKDYETGSLLLNLEYSNTENGYGMIFTTDSNGSRTGEPINLDKSSYGGFEVSWGQEISDWWEIYTDVFGFLNKDMGENNGQTYSVRALSWYAEMNSTFYIGDYWEIQLDFEYYAPEKSLIGKDLGWHVIDFSIGKEILKGNGRLAFSVDDVMNGDIDRSILDLNGFYSSSRSQYQKRQFNLSFNYRFNKKYSKKVKPN